MPRLARIVIPNIPHHVVQRGNRRQTTFFSEHDKAAYLDILKKHLVLNDVQLWAYCLMTNHVHLIVMPAAQESLARGVGGTHQEYTHRINEREGWTGCLWQGRFYSCPLDDPYLFRAIRYVERNPVRAGIVRQAEDYVWSSARAHVFRKRDPILTDIKLKLRVPDWRTYIQVEISDETDELRKHFRTGRPLGETGFTERLEALTGRSIARKKPGPRGPRSKKRASEE